MWDIVGSYPIKVTAASTFKKDQMYDAGAFEGFFIIIAARIITPLHLYIPGKQDCNIIDKNN